MKLTNSVIWANGGSTRWPKSFGPQGKSRGYAHTIRQAVAHTS